MDITETLHTLFFAMGIMIAVCIALEIADDWTKRREAWRRDDR